MSAVLMHLRGEPVRLPDRIAIDPPLLVSFVLLLMLGLVMVTSASITVADSELGRPLHYFSRHLVYAIAGVLAAGLMVTVPMSVWERSSMPLLLLALVLLGSVLVPGIGTEVNGSTRWIRIGGISLQPSEPARLLVILFLAGYLVRQQQPLRESFRAFARPLVFVGAAGVLLLAEPDFGAASVLLATALGMMFIGGACLRHLFVVVAGASAGLAALVISAPYRLRRFTGFLDPWADPYDSGFQLTQALIAIGRGEWLGVGLGGSVQKLFYLPFAHTDFVFAVLAEELGLIGVTATLLLYAVLIGRAFVIGRLAGERGQLFGAYAAHGIGIWLGLQATINIGVNMGALPTKGLTLPLLSSGGSSLLVCCAAVGLLARIHHENHVAPRARRRR